MDRTQAANFTTVNGFRQYIDQNLLGNVAGTELVAADRNATQEELMGVIEGAGIVGSSGNLKQTFQAIKRIAGGNYTPFAASATLTADNAGLVVVDATTANVVLTLAAANAADGVPIKYVFARIDSSTAHSVTIQRAGTDTFNPGTATTYAMSLGEVIGVASDGISAWYSLGSNMTGRRVAAFSASGAWVAPAWVTSPKVRAWGAGGGGGGMGNVAPGGAGGGCGGSYGEGIFEVTPGTSYPVTVGTGGAGGAAGGNNGGAGTTTSFSNLLSVTGSPGGTGFTNGTGGGGGNAGAVSGASISFPGMGGQNGIQISSAVWLGGVGGGCPMGAPPTYNGVISGPNGNIPGGGGGGGTTNYAGGNGAGGFVVVEY